jgi:hypothetical protein
MSWNGSGQFVRNYSWVNDAANNIPITSSRVDADTNDITGNGFGNTLTRDGQGSATSNLPMNGFKHTNCAPGSASTDYATFGQISTLAPLASPAFTGTPTAPTPASGTNSTQIATTAFVTSNFLSLSGGTVSGTITIGGNISMTGTINAGGSINAGSNLTTAGSVIANTNFISSSGNVVLAPGTSGAVIVRPGGSGVTSTQSVFDNGGNLSIPGIINLGGNAQPTIFVQSATPTARNVGDLWFF